MYKCKICQSDIHPKRVEMGYADTCVLHSDTGKYSGFTVTSAKDTREVQVIKNPEVAKRLFYLDKTKGRV